MRQVPGGVGREFLTSMQDPSVVQEQDVAARQRHVLGFGTINRSSQGPQRVGRLTIAWPGMDVVLAIANTLLTMAGREEDR